MSRLSPLPILGVALFFACATLDPEEENALIESARADLAAAGFEFKADVRFRSYRYTTCDGLACGDLRFIQERRTVVLAPEAFESASRLRAALLDIWERYEKPRPGAPEFLARGALRVVLDGQRVGITDVYLLRTAHHRYRQLYDQLGPEDRADLISPENVPYP